ncbi:hypothetical protein [Pedosphaera parvula]|nr:hypothetical protein [Pedosphaera parvula]
MKIVLMIVLCSLAILAAGCATSHSSATAWEYKPKSETTFPGSTWPRILEVEEVYELDYTKDWIHLQFPIRDAADSETLYSFICVGGSDEYLDSLSGVTGVNFVGWLGCVLVEGIESFSESSLLAEEDDPYWHTRGRVSGADLIGKRGEYPEYGRVRHFRLRGLKLTLEFFDIQETSEGEISKLKMRVRVVNDPTAHSAFAEPSGYQYPDK